MKALSQSKLIKLIIALAVCFIGVVFANHVNAATEEVVDSNGFTVTWEYEVQGVNAVNARITKVKNPSNQEIIPMEAEVYDYDGPGPYVRTPMEYRHQYNKIIVPATLGGKQVISVGDGTSRIINNPAYSSDREMDYLEMGVEEVVLPSTIQRINDHAFENCYALYKINLENSITYIGAKAFRNSLLYGENNIVTLNLPTSLEEVGDSAFEVEPKRWFFVEGFMGIRNLTINSNLKKIGDKAFARQHIRNLHIPSTLEEIGKEAFKGCKYISDITIEASSNPLVIGDGAFSELGSGFTSITLPGNVVLGTGVFSGNEKLTTANISTNITELPASTFSGCSRLVTNTTQFTKIGDGAFSGCKALTNENYNNIVQNATEIGKYAFSSCQGLTGEIVVKDIVTSLGGAFADCDNITSVKILPNLTKIPDYLCANCDKLTTVVRPASVTEIGEHSFAACPRITMEEVNNNLLTNVTKIGEGAFANNPQLGPELVLPNTVTELGDRAFYNCTGLENIVFSNNLTTIGAGAFAKIDSLPEVMRFPASVTSIGTNAFENVREAFFGANDVDLAYHWNGLNNVENSVIVHFADCTHKVELINKFEGITVKNTATNANFENGDYACESSLDLIVENTDAYSELVARIRRENRYAGNAYEDEFINLKENNHIVLNNITRDVQIRIQKTENDTDLVVREFISSVNGEEPDERRIPNISTTRKIDNQDPIEYKHTKQPITVEKYDTLTYTIRVYNEDNKPGTVKKLNVYLQDGLELDTGNNNSNSLYNWHVEQTTEQGTIISTNYLKNKTIPAYRGEGKPQYEELEITCKVTKDEAQHLTCIAELADSCDTDAIGGNIQLSQLPDYKLAESMTSHDESFIESAEDDTDYELVTLKNYVKVGYTIAIQKIDDTNLELLNGAKFNLYDKDENLLESKVTVTDGSLVFDEIISYGLGTDTYYIEEVETPAGYEKTFEGKLILTVQKNSETSLSVSYEVNDIIETKTEGRTIIPISTAEELSHIGDNQVYTIDDVDYRFANDGYYQLQNDIDLSEISSWAPLNSYNSNFVLDGNNHKITGMKITWETSSDKNAVGLFGIFSGTVKDLELNIAQMNNFSMSSSMPASGMPNSGVQTAVGGIAGFSMGAVFDNVKVFGNLIIPNYENVGGFIGHTYSGPSIKMKDCLFNGSIVANNNAGGMIGCSKTTVDLISCTSEGSITTTNSSNGVAGGLVGVITKPLGQSTDNVKVKYSQADARIDIILSNKKTRNGNYKIELYKIDKSNPDDIIALDGAKFTIYNENLEPIEGLENVEVRDNGLQIADVIVDTLKSDVFYIKEIEAPEGYDILVKDYVKIVVTKKWNTEKLRYEIDLVPSVTSGKTETQDDSVNTMSGVIFEPEQNYNVAGKSSRLRASNCTNKSRIIASNTAGGIVGIAVSNVNMYDCSNIGYVKANNSVGGIAGQLGHSGRYETAKIIRCTNGVKGDDETVYVQSNGYNTNNVAGLIAFTCAETTIDNCENYAKIEDNAAHVAGIVAVARNTNINIYDCTNYGTIINNNMGATTIDVAGILSVYIKGKMNYAILGETPPVKNGLNCTIDNCTDKGDILGYGQIGGIFGQTYSPGYDEPTAPTTQCTITNCKLESESEDNITTITRKVNNTTKIDHCNMGGICGHIDTDVLTLSNNKIKNANIIQEKYELKGTHSSSPEMGPFKNHIGGIIGSYEPQYCSARTYNATIQDNIVDNLQLTAYSLGNIGGIAGDIEPALKNRNGIYLLNNTVKNSNLEVDCPEYNTMWAGIGGILGSMFYGDNITIDSCKVIDTDIINHSNSRTAGIAGYLKANNNIQITNCEIKSTGRNRHKIQANVPKIQYDEYRYNYNTREYEYVRTNTESNGQSVVGGIVAAIYPDTNYSYNVGANSNIRIFDCRIENQDIEATYEYGGAAVGGVIGVKLFESNNTVNLGKIELNNVKITNHSENRAIQSDSVIGGIIAQIENSSDLNIDTVNLNNVELESSNVVCGGVVGHFKSSSYILNLNKININGMRIENEVNYNTNNATGGIVGAGNAKTISITNSKVNDLAINITGTTINAVGGLIGWHGKSSVINNNELNNISINYTGTNAKGIFAMGGMIGSGNNYSNEQSVITNNKITNLLIKTQNGAIGGILGFIQDSVNIAGNTIENAKLEIENRCNVDINSNINPTNVTGNAFGGLIGIYQGEGDYDFDNSGAHKNANIENNDIKNLEFVITGDTIKTHVGGAIGFIKNFGTANINNTTIDELKISSESTEGIIGGVLGLIKEGQNITITNSNVNNFKADGNYALGGIIGCGIANINNSTVTNMDTSFDTDNVPENKKSIVGGIAGIAIEQSTISNATVTNSASEDEQEPAKVIKSNYLAGGIAGICSGIIKDSKVENITVESTAEIIESHDEDMEESDEPEQGNIPDAVGGTFNNAMAVAAQYLQEFTNVIVRNVTVINGNNSVVVNQ